MTVSSSLLTCLPDGTESLLLFDSNVFRHRIKNKNVTLFLSWFPRRASPAGCVSVQRGTQRPSRTVAGSPGTRTSEMGKEPELQASKAATRELCEVGLQVYNEK